MPTDGQPACSEHAHRVFAAAQAEASRLKHEYIGTEHLLLGLARDREGLARTVLQNLGVHGSTLPSIIEAVIDRGKDASGEIPYRPYTTRAKRALEVALASAVGFGHRSVSTEHLLLGLLDEEYGPAAQILKQHGVTAAAARQELQRLLATTSP